jgi:plasmid stabilization system protein ParE
VLTVIIAPRAIEQIAEVLYKTRVEYGEKKERKYSELVEAALHVLSENPRIGKPCTEVHPDAWTYHIGNWGKKARHLFLYRIREAVEVARFLYDAMDLPRHWLEEWHAT